MIFIIVSHATQAAQIDGRWSAASTTAKSITGDICISKNRLIMAGDKSFTLKQTSMLSGFKAFVGSENVTVFAVDPPANSIFNGNRLCRKPARWIVAWLMPGGELGVAAFDSKRQPQMENEEGFCGDFFYERRVHNNTELNLDRLGLASCLMRMH